MLIRVLYQNGKYDMVKDAFLGKYIESGKLLKFKRKDGWATVGIDPIRGAGGPYVGPERRTVA
jgi:hypothetical protein